jgi:hypothetical protein
MTDSPAFTRNAASPATWWLAALAVHALLLIPIFVSDMPPLVDLPNHLARSIVLADGGKSPNLHSMFEIGWGITPNLAIDAIVPPLIPLVGSMTAVKIYVAAVILVSTSGAIALNVAIFGQLTLWPLLVGLAAYNVLFLMGFLNFQFAIGLALWASAAWIWMAPRRPIAAVLVGVVSGIVIFFCHLFGFALYCMLIGSFEAGSLLRLGLDRRLTVRFFAARGAAIGVTVLVPFLLYVLSPFNKTGGTVVWLSFKRKAALLSAPLLTYSLVLTVVSLALVLCAVLWLAVRRNLQVVAWSWLVLAVLGGLYVVLPVGAKGGYWIDTRIPVIVGFVFFAVTLPRDTRSRPYRLVLATLVALLVVRTASIAQVWNSANQDIRDARAVLHDVTPGSRVFVVDASPPFSLDGVHTPTPAGALPLDLPRFYWHFGAFAMIDEQAFWSTVFAIRGQQPITVRPPYDLSTDAGLSPPPGPEYLTLPPTGRPGVVIPEFIRTWQNTFDYVLFVGVQDGFALDQGLRDQLKMLDRHGSYALYAVLDQSGAPRVAPSR